MTTIQVESTRFGPFDVESEIVLHFPQGMIGFPRQSDYVLIKQRDDSVFLWLHSTTDASLAFPVVLPWAFYWDYEVKLSDDDLGSIEVLNASQISILCVVNVGSDVRQGTINLFSPIVINNDNRTAKQVINTADGYSTRDRLFKAAGDPTPVAMHEGESRNVAILTQAA
ncbi:MAG: flagellar assembly protein FliW [Thermoleophilia bacterium]|nr:flagellar assembly protein FliW [Thermoleophilia bacterium]